MISFTFEALNKITDQASASPTMLATRVMQRVSFCLFF
ncbi:hypothetical protein IMCC3088_34 [Aequoribacter fuscus]|uniref:Uncharacterized protein n=1 Tax=Aequoribacter fuscus TaxID=2518989 RepID=F3L5A3_9GAMM|nr:hypothetical protein IMCC3088_34 [Aequoribacter fuscus]